jgi:acetylornithine deacetylase/succinyl-diaminopimelate desuccinylase-like protein
MFEVVFQGPWGSVLLAGPESEMNPITLANRFITEITKFAADIRNEFRQRNSDQRWPDLVFVPTAIHTRDWISNLPEECTVRFFANVMPPITLEEFRDRIAAFVETFAKRIPRLVEHPPQIKWLPPGVPSYVLPDDSRLWLELSDCHQLAFGTPLHSRFIGGWGDMRLLCSPEVILYGPGGGGGDHHYNEYFELGDLVPTLVTLGLLTARWCGETCC